MLAAIEELLYPPREAGLHSVVKASGHGHAITQVETETMHGHHSDCVDRGLALLPTCTGEQWHHNTILSFLIVSDSQRATASNCKCITDETQKTTAPNTAALMMDAHTVLFPEYRYKNPGAAML